MFQVATFVKLPFALHTLTHNDPDAIYIGLLYGFADRESYGFPIGLKMDILQVCEPTAGKWTRMFLSFFIFVM